MRKTELLDKARKTIKLEAEAISALADKLDNEFVRAVELIDQTSGRVIVTGIGKSGIVAKKIASTFSSIGIPAFFFHPAEGIHGDLGVVRGDDILIAISKSGGTEEIIKVLPLFKRLMIPIIAITGETDSPLARDAEVVLDVAVPDEACSINLIPTSSTTAAIVMGDALAMVLLEKRGFTADDFAVLHPGGSIGRNLAKVEHLMHTGDEVPMVNADTPFSELVLEMTGKRLGFTTVADDNKHLMGVISDGDLRRAIEKKKALDKMKAADVMTVKPKTIAAKKLAIEALNIMEKHKITVLVVTDKNNKITGVLHMHDLLQAKII
jgi:arabinose-5-phosphate isomerase